MPRIDGDNVQRGLKLSFRFDGELVEAFEGETVAAALLAVGVRRLAARQGAPRGVFCNMGVCQECTVLVGREGGAKAPQRACMTEVEDGMIVSSVSDGETT